MVKKVLVVLFSLLLVSVCYGNTLKWKILRGSTTALIVSPNNNSESIYRSVVKYEDDKLDLYEKDFLIYSQDDRIFEKKGSRLTIYVPKNKVDTLEICINNVIILYSDNKISVNYNGNMIDINSHTFYYLDTNTIVTAYGGKPTVIAAGY